jgi:miniconductance mechanosensitive channel
MKSMSYDLKASFTIAEKIHDFLMRLGCSQSVSRLIVDFLGLIIVIAASIVLYSIIRFIIRRFLKRLVLRSVSKWDDYLYENKVFTRLALILPALVIHIFLKATISGYPEVIRVLDVILEIYSVFVILIVVNSFFNAVHQIYSDLSVANAKPIKSYLQIARIILFLVGAIIIISFLIGQSPLNLLAGLGAISAVLFLIFKDSILGLVAGVQISTNNLLQIGDWISMPKYNADGVVTDISLVFVKVRNFDNSMVTVPAYSLVSESFQNWRGMMADGGRRIKRSVLIDIRSVRFCDAPLLENISKHAGQDLMSMLHEGNETNLGYFRHYLMKYLRQNPNINQQMSIVARQLPAGENGVPLEILAFSALPDFPAFENLQSNLFEHVFAIAGEFGLRFYQRASAE